MVRDQTAYSTLMLTEQKTVRLTRGHTMYGLLNPAPQPGATENPAYPNT
jgi:hypothetical protein